MKYRKLLIIISIIALSLTACGAKIEQTTENITVELGEELNFHPTDAFTSSKKKAFDDFVVDSSKIKTEETGTYDLTVTYKDQQYIVHVNVVDTTAPILTRKEDIPTVPAVPSSYKDLPAFALERLPILTPEELVECEDLSECEIFFLTDGAETDEIILYAGISSVQIAARDIYGNQSDILQYTLDLNEADPLDLAYNVLITEWDINEFTQRQQAKACELTDTWADLVTDKIHEINTEYADSLSEEKMAEVVTDIALNTVNIYGENASAQEVEETIDQCTKVLIHQFEQEKAKKEAAERAKREAAEKAQRDATANTQPSSQGDVSFKQALENAGITVHDDKREYVDPEVIRQKFLNDYPGSQYLREDDRFFYFELEDGTRAYIYKNFEFGAFFETPGLSVQ